MEPRSSRLTRQQIRQRAVTEAVTTDGAVRIEDLAQRFDVSVMTVHRDLDELETRGLLRKDRGVARATPTALVESSYIYRAGQQLAEKGAIAQAALEFIEPGQAIVVDDSTTTLQIVPHLQDRAPLTVVTNTLTVLDELNGVKGITLLSLGGKYYDWCSAFMGRMTLDAMSTLRTDVCLMSTSAITDDIAFHQNLEVVDVKRAMFACASKRILMVDHTKFDKRALHTMLPLADFDAVIVDSGTHKAHIERLRENGTNVVVAPQRTGGTATGERSPSADGA